MRLDEFRIYNLVIIVFLCVFLIVEILLIFAIFLGLCSQRLVNENVIQILEVFQFVDSLELVSLVTLVASEYVRIFSHVEHLQVVFEVLQIIDRVVQVWDLVLAK